MFCTYGWKVLSFSHHKLYKSYFSTHWIQCVADIASPRSISPPIVHHWTSKRPTIFRLLSKRTSPWSGSLSRPVHGCLFCSNTPAEFVPHLSITVFMQTVMGVSMYASSKCPHVDFLHASTCRGRRNLLRSLARTSFLSFAASTSGLCIKNPLPGVVARNQMPLPQVYTSPDAVTATLCVSPRAQEVLCWKQHMSHTPTHTLIEAGHISARLQACFKT